MRVWKNKYSFLIIFTLLSFTVFREGKASESWVSVQSLNWLEREDVRVLQLALDIKLSVEAIEAVHSGITLYWDISVKFSEPSVFMTGAVVFLQVERYSLRYDTLFNHYRVQNETKANLQVFSSLEDALYSLQMRQYQQPLVAFSMISSCVDAEIDLHFDIESLPIPLRPTAYFSSAWDLSTNKSLVCD